MDYACAFVKGALGHHRAERKDDGGEQRQQQIHIGWRAIVLKAVVLFNAVDLVTEKGHPEIAFVLRAISFFSVASCSISEYLPLNVLALETMAMRLSWGLALLASVAGVAAQNPETKSPAAAPPGFRFEAIGDKSLGLWEGNEPVFVYHFGAVSSSKAPNARSRSNYFHPLYGLDGEVLTDDFPQDHDYHRGLYWAWSHIRVGDQEYDS